MLSSMLILLSPVVPTGVSSGGHSPNVVLVVGLPEVLVLVVVLLALRFLLVCARSMAMIDERYVVVEFSEACLQRMKPSNNDVLSDRPDER
jgi:hypothetical protein